MGKAENNTASERLTAGVSRAMPRQGIAEERTWWWVLTRGHGGKRLKA
jgi:hypothetical protein